MISCVYSVNNNCLSKMSIESQCLLHACHSVLLKETSDENDYIAQVLFLAHTSAPNTVTRSVCLVCICSNSLRSCRLALSSSCTAADLVWHSLRTRASSCACPAEAVGHLSECFSTCAHGLRFSHFAMLVLWNTPNSFNLHMERDLPICHASIFKPIIPRFTPKTIYKDNSMHIISPKRVQYLCVCQKYCVDHTYKPGALVNTSKLPRFDFYSLWVLSPIKREIGFHGIIHVLIPAKKKKEKE